MNKTLLACLAILSLYLGPPVSPVGTKREDMWRTLFGFLPSSPRAKILLVLKRRKTIIAKLSPLLRNSHAAANNQKTVPADREPTTSERTAHCCDGNDAGDGDRSLEAETELRELA
jgi:hypothetical protein